MSESGTWRCFHCDEVFTDRAEARGHFGLEINSTPACRLTAEDVKALRALEATNTELRAENERLENFEHLYNAGNADRLRRIGDREWWQELDYKNGEIIVLNNHVADLQLKLDCELGVRAMTVARLGGLVEGRRTHSVNFLQRIDALRDIERRWKRAAEK